MLFQIKSCFAQACLVSWISQKGCFQFLDTWICMDIKKLPNASMETEITVSFQVIYWIFAGMPASRNLWWLSWCILDFFLLCYEVIHPGRHSVALQWQSTLGQINLAYPKNENSSRTVINYCHFSVIDIFPLSVPIFSSKFTSLKYLIDFWSNLHFEGDNTWSDNSFVRWALYIRPYGQYCQDWVTRESSWDGLKKVVNYVVS